MKLFVFICVFLALAGTFTKVQCIRRRPTQRIPPSSYSRPTQIGWRQGNGPCICKGPNPTTGHHSSHPTGHPTGHHGPYPTGHHSPYPTGHHGPHPTGHHGPHPTGHHSLHPTGHHGPHPTGHHSPHPTGHHGPHPTGHHSPHPTGHHGPHPTGHHGPHPTGHHSPYPTGRHGPHPTGHHGPHPTGHHGPYPTGHRSPHPTGHRSPHPTGHHGPHPTGHSSRRPWLTKGPYKKCVCRRRPEKLSKIKFRIKKRWDKALSDRLSPAFKKLYMFIVTVIKKVLKKAKEFTQMKFSQGSIVVQFGAVYEVLESGSIEEDPEKALRNAISSGEMKDMDIYPDSLTVSNSYSGINVSEWQTSLEDCRKTCRKPSQMIGQTRTCIEIDASCDGIPLTNQTTCGLACPKHLGHKGITKGKKVFLIVGLVIGVVFLIAVVVVVCRLKKTNNKYLSTSPSSTSIKDLTKNDDLQYQANVDNFKLYSKC